MPSPSSLPERPPRVLATDLDGTLLRPDGSVSTRTHEALARAWAGGIETVLVTARPPRWLHHLASVAGDHGIAICGNGAFVLDVPEREVRWSTGFSRAETLALAADLRAALPEVVFAAERASGPHIEPDFGEHHPESLPPDVVHSPLADLDDEPVGKLLAAHPTLPHEVFFEQVRVIVGDRAVLAVSTELALAELSPPGVSKAAGLARWCAERGIRADEVWAFGDMPNDLPMLRWAGASFAVDNAHDEVLAAATHRCPSNADDGVAAIIEALLARESTAQTQAAR